MANQSPTQCEYLAVVSEWQGREGMVGNAYPIYNLTRGGVVSEPKDEFPNPGAVFLPNRTGLETWDFILLKPVENTLYNNVSSRQCFYIPASRPEVLTNPQRLGTVAVVLEHPGFDLNAATRQLLKPAHSVTPVFFVEAGAAVLGPLLRDAVHCGPFDDVERVHWRPAREDGVVYEFTRDELAKKGVRFDQYSHPDPELNRIIASPITLAIGPVLAVTSARPRDTLSDALLIEWYLQRCPTEDVSRQQIAAIMAAFRARPGDDPAVQAARLKRVEREMGSHLGFLEHRERFAREYVEKSPQGQQRVRDLIEQTVEKKAREVQAEVDRRQSLLAARRSELDREVVRAEQEHQDRLKLLAAEREKAQARITDLETVAGQLRATLAADVGELAGRVRDQLPLLAALAAARPEPAAPATSAATTRQTGRPLEDWQPVPPSAELRPVEKEGRLVEDLHRDLARRGLHFARDFIANVYTCLKAEPLNLIIGPPGHGKSTLVAALARSLGHENALLRIAVRRSWSEDRYLLGFFDSFHGRYDAGPTGLVPRMIQAERDWRQQKAGIYVVLLDEFNLAAPEYYFSQLLQALPSDDPAREVVLYDGTAGPADGFPRRVTLNPNLRFWGTINYDETTERLSARTLDRTGMIFLGTGDVKPSLEEEAAPMPGVAASDVFGRFLRTDEQCPDDRWELALRVIDFLRSPDATLGPRVEVSPRVRKAIKRYLANSTDVLPAAAAVDFVVQQRILPVVRGRGDEFLTRMSRLQQLLADANLPRSALHVEESLRRSRHQFGELDFLTY